MKLPPLPFTKHVIDGYFVTVPCDGYTPVQMQAYAIAVAEAVKAEAVRLCDAVGESDNGWCCADAIKNMEIET